MTREYEFVKNFWAGPDEYTILSRSFEDCKVIRTFGDKSETVYRGDYNDCQEHVDTMVFEYMDGLY